MRCNWVIIDSMSQAYALNSFADDGYWILLHNKIVIGLNEYFLCFWVRRLGWENPLLIYFDWVPGSDDQITNLGHLYPVKYICLYHTFDNPSFGSITFFKLFYHLLRTILHFNPTIPMDASSNLIVIVTHVNRSRFVYKLLDFLSTGLRRCHFDEYCVHCWSVLLENWASVEL